MDNESTINDEFESLMQRVFSGDGQAASQLVQEYEPEVRRIVRHRLHGNQLRRVLDSIDICQSVFGKFFFYAALGKFDIRQPEDLVKLLCKMATNRVIDKHRAESSRQKLVSMRMDENAAKGFEEQIDPAENAASIVEYEDLLQRVRQQMSPDERAISKLRSEGKSWLEVSVELNESPHALRKRLERGCERVFDELGIRVDD